MLCHRTLSQTHIGQLSSLASLRRQDSRHSESNILVPTEAIGIEVVPLGGYFWRARVSRRNPIAYMQSLKDHIAAENDELFPMADDLLSPDEIDKLYYRCIDKDEELGVERKKEFENNINKFKRNEAV